VQARQDFHRRAARPPLRAVAGVRTSGLAHFEPLAEGAGFALARTMDSGARGWCSLAKNRSRTCPRRCRDRRSARLPAWALKNNSTPIKARGSEANQYDSQTNQAAIHSATAVSFAARTTSWTAERKPQARPEQCPQSSSSVQRERGNKLINTTAFVQKAILASPTMTRHRAPESPAREDEHLHN